MTAAALVGLWLAGWFAVLVASFRADVAPIEPDPVGYALLLGWLWPVAAPFLLAAYLASRVAERIR